MSLRPIDFHSMVPKVNEQTRLQNEETHRNIAQQQQQADQASRGAQAQTQTVYQQEGAQKAGIREKREDRRKDRKKTAKEQEEQETADQYGQNEQGPTRRSGSDHAVSSLAACSA